MAVRPPPACRLVAAGIEAHRQRRERLGEFGAAVALSSDGSTAMVGGASIDAAPAQGGAAWGFARSGSSWAQEGSEIVPTDESGLGDFGLAVALSSDGNTALIGGPDDAGSVGAVWAFTRSGSVWAQQGPKLTGGAERGSGSFGAGVALSSDAATAMIGGPADSSSNGAAWPFVASGITVTPASGGDAISADTTGGAFTDLTGPVLTENAPGLIGTGTVVLNAPAGFAFDASAAPACRGTSGLTASVTALTAATITCTVTAASSGSAGTLTFIGVTIQPTWPGRRSLPARSPSPAPPRSRERQEATGRSPRLRAPQASWHSLRNRPAQRAVPRCQRCPW